MRRPDEEKTRELTRLFERIYNATSTRINGQHDVEVIQLLKPYIDVVYDDLDKRAEILDVACDRFIHEAAIKRRNEINENEELRLLERQWNIRSILHQHYRTTRTDISLRQLHQHLRQTYAITMTLDKLKDVLPKLGFNVITTRNSNTVVMEDNRIHLDRIKYIRDMQKVRLEQKSIVYFGEANVDIVWASNGNSNRLILLFAAGPKGLVNFTFAHKKSNEISAENFCEWLQAVSGNLEKGTVLVVEDLPYTRIQLSDSEPPTRRAMMRWLKVNDIQFDNDWTSVELRELIRRTPLVPQSKRMSFLRGQRESRIDQAAREIGHIVIRIPPNHQELRPFSNASFFEPVVIDAKAADSALVTMAEDARNRVRSRLDESKMGQWKMYCDQIERVELSFLQFERFVNAVEGGVDGGNCSKDDAAIVIGSSDEESDNQSS